jgi:hypothetical protein
MGNRRNEFAFYAPDPDANVVLVLRVPRHVKDKISRQAEEAGSTISAWCSSALEQAATRRYKVQCFHPPEVRVNGWCFAPGCKTWLGADTAEGT